ncbi:hypothetical protein ACDA63_12180 [Uliginosibacterium sp. sgz301328]|uniref:hypothetical protein n=1 Tax=Uliginosibacterium sp. sgz301328 TaxID=3243764 RepID=UPI00359CC255
MKYLKLAGLVGVTALATACGLTESATTAATVAKTQAMAAEQARKQGDQIVLKMQQANEDEQRRLQQQLDAADAGNK